MIFCLHEEEIEKLKKYQEYNWYSRYSWCKPCQFQLKKKKNNDISTPTKNCLSKKFHEATTLWKQKYVEAVAPNQTDKFISQALNSSNQNSDEEEKVSGELREHLYAFKQCDFWENL